MSKPLAKFVVELWLEGPGVWKVHYDSPDRDMAEGILEYLRRAGARARLLENGQILKETDHE